jgi:hypothetical protein
MIHPLTILRMTARAGLLFALLAAPIVLVPTVKTGNQVTIEQPVQAKKGLGLVLLIALQRG